VTKGFDFAAGEGPIEHVFVLMLENRSFDHFFALSGIAGITAAKPNDQHFVNRHAGRDFYFESGAPERMPTDPLHEFGDVVQQLTTNGKFVARKPYPPCNNGGFVDNYATTAPPRHPLSDGELNYIMAGAASAQLPALTTLAKNFVLCDHWYASLPGPTWPNRFFVHGASSMGFEGSPGFPQIAIWESLRGFEYTNGSLFDALGNGGWRLYQDRHGPLSGQVPQVGALKGISFFDVHGMDGFTADLSGDYPWRYTFIEPAYGNIIDDSYRGGSSQHPMDGIAGGDRLVAKVYNALRASPLWEKSLLVITYDEHGGFYDSQPPVPMTPPGDTSTFPYGGNGFDFSLSGVRVPAVIVSPWVGDGAVDDRPYDHSSVSATLHKLFGTHLLTGRDRHANDLTALLTGTCRTDCPDYVEPPELPDMAEEIDTASDPAMLAAPVPAEGNLPGFLYVVKKAQEESEVEPLVALPSATAFAAMTRGEAEAYLHTVLPPLIEERELRHGALLG